MEILHLTVRVVHVLGAVFWAGATFLIALFVEPSVREIGPAGGAFMQAMTKRGYARIVTGIAVVTVLTGLWLLWRMSGHFSAGFMASRSGILLSTGMVTGILALGMGAHMVRPTINKLVALGEEIAGGSAPPTPEQQAKLAGLQKKVRTGTRIIAWLLLITLVTMALGPHV